MPFLVNFGVCKVITNILLVFVVIGLFMIVSRLNDLVHLVMKSNTNTGQIAKCDEKLEIIMLKGMSDE